MLPDDRCKQKIVHMNQDLLQSTVNSNEIFMCTHCHQPMRPNVVMFNDTDENVLKEINSQRERYQTWEGLVENQVANNNGKFVILEVGCGVTVPAVRQESEEVLVDCSKKLKSQSSKGTGSVSLIRINPKDAKVEIDEVHQFENISISSTAALALCKIDCWLKALFGDKEIEMRTRFKVLNGTK